MHFFLKTEPESLTWLFPNSTSQRTVTELLTGFVLFGFYGAAGLPEGGSISYRISLVSVCVLLPLVTLATWFLVRRKAAMVLKADR